MEYIEIIFLISIYTLAIYLERTKFVISPFVWWIGVGIEIILMIIGVARYSWVESIIAFVLAFVIFTFNYEKHFSFIGGGILKGLIMGTLYFGRYSILFVVIFFVGFLLLKKRNEKKTYDIPGQSLVSAMPLVLISALFTYLVEMVVTNMEVVLNLFI